MVFSSLIIRYPTTTHHRHYVVYQLSVWCPCNGNYLKKTICLLIFTSYVLGGQAEKVWDHSNHTHTYHIPTFLYHLKLFNSIIWYMLCACTIFSEGFWSILVSTPHLHSSPLITACDSCWSTMKGQLEVVCIIMCCYLSPLDLLWPMLLLLWRCIALWVTDRCRVVCCYALKPIGDLHDGL